VKYDLLATIAEQMTNSILCVNVQSGHQFQHVCQLSSCDFSSRINFLAALSALTH